MKRLTEDDLIGLRDTFSDFEGNRVSDAIDDGRRCSRPDGTSQSHDRGPGAVNVWRRRRVSC
jgi:hypothetical protein